MGFTARDIVRFTQARASLPELAEQVKTGAEKIITKNGESYVALIDSDRLVYYHRLERERIHLLLIDDARNGLADVAAGRTQEADAAIAALQKRRAARLRRPLVAIRDTVIPSLRRFPRVGRRYLDQPLQSAEAIARLGPLTAWAAADSGCAVRVCWYSLATLSRHCWWRPL